MNQNLSFHTLQRGNAACDAPASRAERWSIPR
ncbi:MAG: DUF1534 domain-containing protein [Methyloprofundus sp.]|nr:DUF1534 domain-containing protein [Methyloprofundus sp.]